MNEQPFQQRVQPWMMECFGPAIAADTQERNHRFLEEALELVQSCGATQSEAHQLVDYVYGRAVGEKVQEVGGVMVTLAALCLAQDLDMHQASEVELARIWTKVEQIRAKQAAKPKHSPLPAAAPVAAPLERHNLLELVVPKRMGFQGNDTGFVTGWNACRSAVISAAPVAAQEPVAWHYTNSGSVGFHYGPFRPDERASWVPLYGTSQPAQGEPCSLCDGAGTLDGTQATCPNCDRTGVEPAQGECQPEPDGPCDNCGLGHPSSNCIYKPAQADLLPPLNICNDRDMLNYLMQAFDNEMHVCGRCGESDATEHMDSANFLRQFLAAAPTAPETWKVLPSQAMPADHKQFAIVLDRDFSDGLSLAVHDGINYMFSDGDCFNRDGDTLDGYTAEFLTQYELEQRLSAAAAKPFIPRTPEDMIAFIGSQYGSMRFATEDGIELPKEDVSYSLSVHDLIGAFSMAGFYDVDAEPASDAAAIRATALEEAAKTCDLLEGDPGPYADLAEKSACAIRALIGGSKP